MQRCLGLVEDAREGRFSLFEVGFLHGNGQVLLRDRVTAGGRELVAHDSVEVGAEEIELVASQRLLHKLAHVGVIEHAVHDGFLYAGACTVAVQESRPAVNDARLLVFGGCDIVDVADAQCHRPFIFTEPGDAAGHNRFVAQYVARALRRGLVAGGASVIAARLPGLAVAALSGLCLGGGALLLLAGVP